MMTTEEMLALPTNGVDRWLIRGKLREKPMTVRNRWHSSVEARIVYLLSDWNEKQPRPRGMIHSGEAGCRLRQTPDSTVGIDVVYLSPTLAALDPTETTLIDGVPTVAVEILSPSDRVEEIQEKIDTYLEVGVAHVWIIDVHFRIVVVHRPGQRPIMLNDTQEITAEPDLPGFRASVAAFFP